MIKHAHRWLRIASLAGMIGIGCAGAVRADELWVTPTNQADFGGLGVSSNVIWPVSPAGIVRFVWAIPDDLQAFQGAKIAIIPNAPGGASTLNVLVCPAQNGNVVAAACAGPFTLAFTGVANQLVDVDISATLSSRIGTPGANYLAVLAYTTPTTATDHVVGLRFSYVSKAPSGVGSVTSVATGAGLTGGPITASGTLSVANGGVLNTMLANSSVTIAPGVGLTGGGPVSLGGSVSLANSGVLSVSASTPLTSTGGPNPIIGLASLPAGSPNYIQNGSAGQTASFKITGNGQITGGLSVSSSGAGPSISGSGVGGVGVSGSSTTNNGVIGSTSGTSGQSGVTGFGVQYGVLGFASATDVGWGVKGVGAGNTVGVEGISSAGVGVRGSLLSCDSNGCVPTAGEAGQFVTGAGGILLHGFLSNSNGPGGWNEKFVVDAAGNLSIYGNGSKPGGGSWSTLSDRRTKKSIEPLHSALNQLLKLRGVSYEYTNPSSFGEFAGIHLGMVAQDVEQVFPSWVDTGADGYKRLTFRGFEAVTVEAMRELEARVETSAGDATRRIADLERQNDQLRRTVEALAATVEALQPR